LAQAQARQCSFRFLPMRTTGKMARCSSLLFALCLMLPAVRADNTTEASGSVANTSSESSPQAAHTSVAGVNASGEPSGAPGALLLNSSSFSRDRPTSAPVSPFFCWGKQDGSYCAWQANARVDCQNWQSAFVRYCAARNTCSEWQEGWFTFRARCKGGPPGQHHDSCWGRRDGTYCDSTGRAVVGCRNGRQRTVQQCGQRQRCVQRRGGAATCGTRRLAVAAPSAPGDAFLV